MMLLLWVVAVVIVVLAIAAAVLYWLWKEYRQIARCSKRIDGSQSTIIVHAYRPLDEIRVEDKDESTTFCKANIAKGATVEYVYQSSAENVRVFVRYDGEEHELKVENE